MGRLICQEVFSRFFKFFCGVRDPWCCGTDTPGGVSLRGGTEVVPIRRTCSVLGSMFCGTVDARSLRRAVCHPWRPERRGRRSLREVFWKSPCRDTPPGVSARVPVAITDTRGRVSLQKKNGAAGAAPFGYIAFGDYTSSMIAISAASPRRSPMRITRV